MGDKNLSRLDYDSIILQECVVSVLNVFEVDAPAAVLDQNSSIARW